MSHYTYLITPDSLIPVPTYPIPSQSTSPQAYLVLRTVATDPTLHPHGRTSRDPVPAGRLTPLSLHQAAATDCMYWELSPDGGSG